MEKNNKTYFQNKAEKSFKGFQFYIFILIAIAFCSYLYINIFDFDDNWKIFMNTLLTAIIVPMFFSLGNKLLDRFFYFQDTYQLCVETEYKYEHKLIDKLEYERRIRELKEMENNTPILDKKTNIFQSNKDAIIFALIISVFCIFLILTIPYLFKLQGDILSFSGAIIGGGLTLIGVYLTIDYNNKANKEQREQHDKERKEELAIQYKPIPLIDITPQEEPFLDSDKQFLHLNLTLTNVGRAEGIKLLIKNHYGENLKFEHNYTDIAVKQIINFIIAIPIKCFEFNTISLDKERDIEQWTATQYLTFEYYDIFDNRYKEVYQVNVTMKEDFSSAMQYSIEKIQ